MMLPTASTLAIAAQPPCSSSTAIARSAVSSMSALDASVAASTDVLIIAVVSGQSIISDAAGGGKGAPAYRSRDAAAATAAAVMTALVAAALASLAFASPADAIVVLPKPQDQVEASAARARALSALPTFPLLEAQRNIEMLLADQESFRTCVALGLPTGRLQMPAMLESGVFLNLELVAKDPAALRTAAQAYMLDASKANEYLAYAEGAQIEKASATQVAEYLDVAFAAVERCSANLQRILVQAPPAR
jgi:hypothetical protein